MEQTYFYYYDEQVKTICRLKHELTKEEIGNYVQISKEEYDQLKRGNSNSPKEQDKRRELRKQIVALKLRLKETDYQAIKYAEGVISEEDYAPIKAQRQAWRNEINELEAQLNAIAENN